MRGAILAGGRASRFGGSAKGLEVVAGQRMIDRVAEAIHTATGDAPLLVANDPEAPAWRRGLSVTRDARPGCGALGGIYTALMAGAGPVLVVAWDMPFVTPALLKALIEGAPPYDVFLPESGGPKHVEPLCGVYAQAALEAIRLRLDQGDYRAVGFHDQVRLGILPIERVRRFGDPGRLFFNVNTADDLRRAREGGR